MKILHTSDWHFGKHLGKFSRIDEQGEFADELCEICDSNEVDIVLMIADIFDMYNPSSEVETSYLRL